MFKTLFSNRLFIGALAFFVLCVTGSLLYLQHVEKQSARALAEAEERIKTLTEKQNPQPPAEAPVVENPEQPQQDGHFHADGTWHEGAHEAHVEQESTAEGREPPAPTGGNVDSPLTESEIKSLYHQLGRDIAEMSPEEYDKPPDLSRYSQKQINYLRKRGINVDLLPPDVQKIVEAHQWKQKGVEPPPPGYTYLQKEDGTYFLHKEGEPLIQVHTNADGNVTGASASFTGASGRDPIELMREVARKARKRMEDERADGSSGGKR